MKSKITKFILIMLFSLPILFLINTGFLDISPFKVLQTVIFSTTIGVNFVFIKFRKFVFLLALLLIIIMSLLYTIDIIYIADMFGSTGLGLVLLTTLSYMPELIKNGYVKKI